MILKHSIQAPARGHEAHKLISKTIYLILVENEAYAFNFARCVHPKYYANHLQLKSIEIHIHKIRTPEVKVIIL